MVFLVLVSSALAAPTRQFSCELLTLVDPAMVEHVDFGVDANDIPTVARVTNVQSGSVVLLTRPPVYRPNYDGGFWSTTYGLDAYRLGTVAGWTTYTLLVPNGPLGAQFDVQVHLSFDRGAAGWWPNEFACVEIP